MFKKIIIHTIFLGLLAQLVMVPVYAEAKPDFVITDIEIVTDNTFNEDYFLVKYKNNGGSIEGEPITIGITDSVTQSSYYQRPINPDYDAYTAYDLKMGYAIKPTDTGKYQLTAVVDSLNIFDESNENNNTFTKTITVEKPDLTITKAESVGADTIRVYYSNIGNTPSPEGFKIKYNSNINSLSDYKIIRVKTEMPVGESRYIDFSLPAGFYDLTFTIDSTDLVDEYNENNNSYSQVFNLNTTPIVGNVEVVSTTQDSAIIKWTTSENSVGKIIYGTGMTDSEMSYLSAISDITKNHQHLISNLKSNTTYYYKIIAENNNQKIAQSNAMSFTTKAEVKNEKPDFVIKDITIEKDTQYDAYYIYVDFVNNGGLSPVGTMGVEVVDQNNGRKYTQELVGGSYGQGSGYNNLYMYQPLVLNTSGIYNLKASVDTKNTFNESNENNNTFQKQISLNTGYNHVIDNNLSKKLSGRLLLAVEDKGRIYYVDTVNYKKHEATFANLMDLFKSLSLGITHTDLEKIPNNANMQNRLKGKLLLDVNDKGRIWYVAQDGKLWEVTFSGAMNLFESLSLGITNADLAKIAE